MALEKALALNQTAAPHYAQLGEKELALSHLRKAVELGFDDIEWLTTNDTLALLRADSSFIALLEEVKRKKQGHAEPETAPATSSAPAPANYVPDAAPPAPDAGEAPEQPGPARADMDRTPSPNQGVFQVTQETSLRQQPGPAYKVLKRLPVGAEAALLEKTDRYWWRVSCNGQAGYVKAHLLAPVE